MFVSAISPIVLCKYNFIFKSFCLLHFFFCPQGKRRIDKAYLFFRLITNKCTPMQYQHLWPWSHLAQRKYTLIIAIATVCLKYTFSVTSDFGQSVSTWRTFKTSNGPTSVSSKVETKFGACYANKPWQICQSEKFAVAYEFAFCSFCCKP